VLNMLAENGRDHRSAMRVRCAPATTVAERALRTAREFGSRTMEWLLTREDRH
jgi:hypothetical protein